MPQNTTVRLAEPQPASPQTLSVIRYEEKGTDVNLASYLMLDAFDNDYELAVVISNDSDLVTPIRIARERFGLTVGVLNPHPSRSRTLAAAADFYRPIRRGPLSAAQFPDRMRDSAGAFAKPAGRRPTPYPPAARSTRSTCSAPGGSVPASTARIASITASL